MIFIVLLMLLFGLLGYLMGSVSGRRIPRLAASFFLMVAWVLLLVTLVVRGAIAGHWPLGSQYEFTLGFALIILSLYLLIESHHQAWQAGPWASVILILLLVRAIMLPSQARAIAPLPPILRSPWLQAHVLTIMVSYGAYAVAAALGLAALIAGSDRRKGDPADPGGHAQAEKTGLIMQRVLALAFPWLTLGILTGAIWAHKAWGRYWGWDPKETWALITWLWYLLILHLQSVQGWRNKRLCWLVCGGLFLVMFTFIGVPYLAKSLALDTLHGY